MTDEALKSGSSGLSNIVQKPHFCDTPKIFQETKSNVFETHIDEKLLWYLLAPVLQTAVLPHK